LENTLSQGYSGFLKVSEELKIPVVVYRILEQHRYLSHAGGEYRDQQPEKVEKVEKRV
jgi:hypothetical protein